MLFKFIKASKVNKRKLHLVAEIQRLNEWLASFSSQTNEIQETAFYKIWQVKDEGNLSWDNALNRADVKEELYQLLLHKQFIGYIAEDLRQKTYELMKLEGTAPAPLSKAEYSKSIEHGVAPSEMQTIFEAFVKELKPSILEFERDVSI